MKDEKFIEHAENALKDLEENVKESRKAIDSATSTLASTFFSAIVGLFSGLGLLSDLLEHANNLRDNTLLFLLACIIFSLAVSILANMKSHKACLNNSEENIRLIMNVLNGGAREVKPKESNVKLLNCIHEKTFILAVVTIVMFCFKLIYNNWN